MNNINLFSSRRQHLDRAFLAEKLRDAKSYKRIAGYFRSSIFELVGEEIAAILKVHFSGFFPVAAMWPMIPWFSWEKPCSVATKPSWRSAPGSYNPNDLRGILEGKIRNKS
jgi:hypothetical protein